MNHRKPKSSYLRPQFSMLWAGVVCTGMCALLAVMAATGTDPLQLLAGSLLVVVLLAVAVLCIELATRIIPYAQREPVQMTEKERLTLYRNFEEHRRDSLPEDASPFARQEAAYNAASPFGPPKAPEREAAEMDSGYDTLPGDSSIT